jgi:hypothetical protein
MAKLGVRFAVPQHFLGRPLWRLFAEKQILGNCVGLGAFHG